MPKTPKPKAPAAGQESVSPSSAHRRLLADPSQDLDLSQSSASTAKLPRPIPSDTQTLYIELFERLKGLEFDRTFGNLAGAFSRKSKDGKEHWYFRTSEGARGRKEYYVGPDHEQTRKLIAQHQNLCAESMEVTADIHRMASMLMVGGCASIDHASAKVIHALAASGLFRLGGVLVGTHAYVAMGNMLGVRWQSASRTQDIDFASFRALEILVPPMEPGVWGTLEALNMGFLPTPGLDPRSPSTSYAIRGQKLRVDLLTTASRTGPFSPVYIPRFDASALPVPFMDYLLEGTLDAMVINGGATLVKIPDPARFGFHKLIVSEERPIIEHTKATKDRTQAAEVLNHLLRVRPGDLELAYDRLEAKGLHKRVAKAIRQHLSQEQEILVFIDQRSK